MRGVAIFMKIILSGQEFVPERNDNFFGRLQGGADRGGGWQGASFRKKSTAVFFSVKRS